LTGVMPIVTFTPFSSTEGAGVSSILCEATDLEKIGLASSTRPMQPPCIQVAA